MATNLLSSDHADEDYIDMEIGSHTNFFYHPRSSPPHPREFEFQMFSSSSERETTSPADELFYKGKLLPLHLPPRIQMVEKLLLSDFYQKDQDTFDEFFSTPLPTNANTTPTANTPFESCNISPLESCQVSRELNPEEYFSEYSTEASEFNGKNPKKSWTRNIGSKLTKQSSLGSKLKASRAYLKSLFSKSACTDESSARSIGDEAVPKARESVSSYTKVAKKVPFGKFQKVDTNQILTTGTRSFNKEKFEKDSSRHHRRSFSGAIKRLSTTKSSSSLISSGSSTSSSESNSSSFHELQFHKRSSSGISEIENPIQGAIAHCKSSQHQIYPRKAINDVGFYSLSTSRRICEDQERQVLCRG